MSLSSTLIDTHAQTYWQRLCEKLPQIESDIAEKQRLMAILGLSDFIAESLCTQPELLTFLNQQTVANLASLDYAALLENELLAVDSEEHLQRVLRQFRKRHMLLLAWQDLLNLQPITVSLKKVSALADALILQAYQWLYDFHCAKLGTPQGEFGPQPLFILGMGKLGGRELNFSSDIDLIFCYPESGEIANIRKPIENQQFFNRLAQKLIAALNQITVDGQVFRVDMRLRPFGDSGPLVMHFDAFEDYYQEQGREWERYAMVKARIINPSCNYSDRLVDILRPFVYRRYIDYSAIDSLRKMKSLISQEVRRRGLTNNIKLGQGGIREVEFIAQSFQLIKGGRTTELQITSLLDTIAILIKEQLLPEKDALALKNSYLYLRKVEHCLQQFNDQQTQLLPDNDLDQIRLCHVLKCHDYTQFTQQLQEHMSLIHNQFSLLVGESKQSDDNSITGDTHAYSDLWLLELTIEEMIDTLPKWQEIAIPNAFYEHLLYFKANVNKRGISARAQDTLNQLMPTLLQSIFSQSPPESTSESFAELLHRLLTILQAICGRTTYLQLLCENQGAQRQLVLLCDASPWIAELLSRYPILLDELLNPTTLYNPTPFHEYPQELRETLLRVEPDDLEMQMEMLRQFKQIQQLKIAAADVTGALPIMQVSDHLTFLAEAIIAEVVNMAWQQMREKYGVPPDTNDEQKCFAVLGYGKLGGIELGYGSDLDLVFLHNSEKSGLTDGPKVIESGQFYTKLAQRIMHLFMTKTPSGQLYEVDMRLRPSGNAGLLVCHIEGFKAYQEQQAWTWEHQALVRARIVYGDSHFMQQIQQIRHHVLARPRDISALQHDVTNMRVKMRENLSKGNHLMLDIKQDAGGMVDIEFLVQYWVLANISTYPKLSRWSDNVRILEQLAEFEIISAETEKQLIHAYLTYRNTAHRLTLLQLPIISAKAEFADSQEIVSQIWAETFA